MAIVRDYARAVAGGLLVGLPLLYTMEVWFDGATLPPARIVVLLAVSFGLVVAFNLIAGFRKDRTVTQVVVDAVEAMGLAMALAAVTLFLIGQLEASAIAVAAGKIALESIPVAFGVSLARTQFSGGQRGAGEASGGANARGGGRGSSHPGGAGSVEALDRLGRGHAGPLAQLVLAAAGALVFALNVAPTEEVVLVATGTGPWVLAALVAASLFLTFVLVFWSNFGAALRAASPLEQPLGETVAAYAVSIGVALLLLWAFGRTAGEGIASIAAMTVVLGFVAGVGGAVGRLLVGGGTEGDQRGPRRATR